MGALYQRGGNACESETIGVSWDKAKNIQSEGKTLKLNNW